jgi:hypothetical protein
MQVDCTPGERPRSAPIRSARNWPCLEIWMPAGAGQDAVTPQDRSSSSSSSSRRAIRIPGLARAAATGALLAFFETAGAGAETGGAGSSAVWMRGGAAGTAFGADGAASSGLDDGTGSGSGKLGPAMTTTVRGDALTGITARPLTSPAVIAAKPPITKRSMVRLSQRKGLTSVIVAAAW